jgi:hypothetical protein
MEALADSVGLRALGLGPRMIDVLDGEIELVVVMFRFDAVAEPALLRRSRCIARALR